MRRARSGGWWAVALGLTALVFAGNFAKTGFGVFGDGVGYYAPARSLVFDHDLRVDDEMARFTPDRWVHPIPEHSKYPIGSSLVLAPFLVIAHGVALGARALGAAVTTDGYSWPYELAYCAGSALFGVLGLVLCHRAAARSTDPFAATVAVVGVWFASPLFYYLTVETSMAHAVSQALVSATLYLGLTSDWLRDRRAAWQVGAALGLATLARPQDGLFAITLAAWALWPAADGPIVEPLRERLVALLVAGSAAAAVASLQLAIYVLAFGGLANVPYWLEASAAGRGPTFDWFHPRLAAVLFSSFHGLFFWHPLTFAAVLGLAVLGRRSPRIATGLALGWAAQVWVIGAWHAWWQGASLGGRMFSSSSFVFTLGLAALWATPGSRARRGLAVALTALCVAWNGSLVIQYRLGMIPGEEPVALSRILAGHVEVARKLVGRIVGP